MALNAYDKQRLQGAEEILLRIKTFAREKGITLLECRWNRGGEIISGDKHLLEVRARGKSSKGIFSDEQLAGYPCGIGTERTDCALREMVCNLA
jgi:hypothetical protein